MTEPRAAHGFPGYFVSRDGVVYSRHRWLKTLKEVRSYPTPKGYRKVNLFRDGKRKAVFVQLARGGNLSFKIAEEIRSDYFAGRGTQYTLAEKYGASQPMIFKIIKRQCWTHERGSP